MNCLYKLEKFLKNIYIYIYIEGLINFQKDARETDYTRRDFITRASHVLPRVELSG